MKAKIKALKFELRNNGKFNNSIKTTTHSSIFLKLFYKNSNFSFNYKGNNIDYSKTNLNNNDSKHFINNVLISKELEKSLSTSCINGINGINATNGSIGKENIKTCEFINKCKYIINTTNDLIFSSALNTPKKKCCLKLIEMI